MVMQYIKQIMGFIFFIMLASCGQSNDEKSSTHVVVVKNETLQNRLFYAGTIQPLKTIVITSPVEGVIDDMSFRFGEEIKTNQPMFVISSDKFLADYKSALMQYIKAKTDFNNAKSQLSENEFLHKNQLISDDDFKAKQTNFYTSQLSLLQAKDAFAIFLKQLNTNVNLYDLSIEEVDKITKALHIEESAKNITVLSPADGVALLPIKNDGNDSLNAKISKGEQIKQGDVLAMIGDISGLTIHVNVNEFNVNQLKIGQDVTVTGNAFPEYELKGKIAGIDRQAQMGQGGAPQFAVEVIVPTLTKKQQEIIHVGMSAKVEMNVGGGSAIVVPIHAIYEKNGKMFVRLEEDGKIKETPVVTGPTTANAVVIESNLKVGDRVVVVD